MFSSKTNITKTSFDFLQICETYAYELAIWRLTKDKMYWTIKLFTLGNSILVSTIYICFPSHINCEKKRKRKGT